MRSHLDLTLRNAKIDGVNLPGGGGFTRIRANGVGYRAKMARPGGLEPPTYRLEGGCSILLSYGRKYGAGDGIRTRDIQLGRLTLYQLSYSRTWSGRLDSNQRPPAPKAGALPTALRPAKHVISYAKLQFNTLPTLNGEDSYCAYTSLRWVPGPSAWPLLALHRRNFRHALP